MNNVDNEQNELSVNGSNSISEEADSSSESENYLSDCSESDRDNVELEDLDDSFVVSKGSLEEQETETGVSMSKEFQDRLREWAIIGNISHNNLSELMKLLYTQFKIPFLNQHPRTFLGTPRTGHNIIKINNGEYWHHGVRKCLLQTLGNAPFQSEIQLNINIDGIPLYKSSNQQFWPILGKIKFLF